MEVQNVPDGTDRGRKRKASGYELMKRRHVIVEEQLEVERKEKDVLVTLLEQEKGRVRELTKQVNDTQIMKRRQVIVEEQLVVERKEKDVLFALLEQEKGRVKDLTNQLMNTESRVMHLEADKYFLGADLEEKSIEEAELKEKYRQLKEKSFKDEEKVRVHKIRTKKQVLKAFEWGESTADPVLLRAVCGFWEAISNPVQDVDYTEATKKRISKLDVMKMWMEVTLNGWAGKTKDALLKEFIQSKKYCPIQMARSSDVNSTFNVRAASDIAKCDQTRKKYERGLLPSDQTCRRVMQCVYKAAVGLGFSSFPVEENGNVWCWGDADGRFKNGVNRYVYEVYCKIDPFCEKAPSHDPWLVPLTGDGTRVSYRGKSITMCGVKQADTRLPSQHETGKTMNQSRHMYLPALAGYTDEKTIMPYFEEFVQAFLEIEERGYCVVDNQQYNIYIRCFVVGDLAFEQKYLGRGGGSGKTTRFCFLCSNTCHYRHKGYPGGCMKCRKEGIVYDELTGVQKCLCHDVCTPEFLKWEKERFEDLSERVATTIPLSKLPVWESVGALRHECCKRAVTPQDRARLNKMTTEAQMQHWLLTQCRQGCTITAIEAHGIRFCPLAIVNEDLNERNVDCRGFSDLEKRHRLEMILREEEEWQQMVMYRRDTRFSTDASTTNMTLRLDRTVVDMLHCPMRTNEKVLNLLYDEILNGKTKNEVNGRRRGSTKRKKKQVVGDVAVGQPVAKMFVNEHGLPDLYRGVVAAFTDEGNRQLYSVVYDDEDQEDLDAKEFSEAHAFAQLLLKDQSTEERRLQNLERKTVSPKLIDLTNVIRELGSLGESWTHQWDEGNTKSLKKIKLPFDQSKKIFKTHQLQTLKTAVDIAVHEDRTESRVNWKTFLELYVSMIETLTKSEDYVGDEIDELDEKIKKCYAMLMKIAGMKGCTNYFHLLGSGHVIWFTRRYGNLWRWRNEGAESQNSVLSLRYNKFNNRGGNKGNSLNKDIKEKCFPFQVLGAWMARLTMWHLGLGEGLFDADIGDDDESEL